MTQFQPPPPGPGIGPGGPVGVSPGFVGPVRWSTAAVSGFVLSLLGCLGVTALLGLILGIVGIVTTRGGRRRGMGLAIAAIPISLLTGALTLIVATGVFLFGHVLIQAKDQLPQILSLDASELAQPDSLLRQLCSDSFNQEVDTERLAAWLRAVKDKQGKLIEVTGFSSVQPAKSSGKKAVNLEGKFVNGRANITITFEARGFDFNIDDIEIDGVSPRNPE